MSQNNVAAAEATGHRDPQYRRPQHQRPDACAQSFISTAARPMTRSPTCAPRSTTSRIRPNCLRIWASPTSAAGRSNSPTRPFSMRPRPPIIRRPLASTMSRFCGDAGSATQAESVVTDLATRNPNSVPVLSALAQVKLAHQDWVGAHAIADSHPPAGRQKRCCRSDQRRRLQRREEIRRQPGGAAKAPMTPIPAPSRPMAAIGRRLSAGEADGSGRGISRRPR